MDNKDLKYLKKHYGEKFAHLCRDLFPTILETEGLLTKIITEHFDETRSLYDAITSEPRVVDDFKSFVFSFVDVEDEEVQEVKTQSPEELMDKAGYILYPECKTEADIQRFRHYYSRGDGSKTPERADGNIEGEELCTFRGGRLNSCRVWFAVKKDVDKIKREDFKKPQRQDEYGTSVISIQFTLGDKPTLSIKNRYNHTVNNPDATFSNNLENICEGLTDAFRQTYGIEMVGGQKNVEIPGFTIDVYRKYYKTNVETGNVHYCENNTIVDLGITHKLDKNRYILIDNYVVDLNKKRIARGENYRAIEDKDVVSYYATGDAFIESIGEIKDIKVLKTENGNKNIIITPTEGEDVTITINERNQIIGYKNENVTEIKDDFLSKSTSIQKISLPNVTEIGDDFLYMNNGLRSLSLPKVEKVGSSFLRGDKTLESISMPKVVVVGSFFLFLNNRIDSISFPELVKIGKCFMCLNDVIDKVSLPNVKEILSEFLANNKVVKELDMPKVESIGSFFMELNRALKEINLPNLREVDHAFLNHNEIINKVYMPKLDEVGACFMSGNKDLKELSLPCLKKFDRNFLENNEKLKKISMPSIKDLEKEKMLRNNPRRNELLDEIIKSAQKNWERSKEK